MRKIKNSYYALLPGDQDYEILSITNIVMSFVRITFQWKQTQNDNISIIGLLA